MLAKLLTVLLLSSSLLSAAQAPYMVTVSTGTYTPLSGVPLTYSARDDGYYFNANFTFKVFDRTIDFKQITSPKPSNGGFIASQGYVAMYETPTLDNTVALQCLYLDSFRTVNNITKVYGVVEGAAGNRTLKMEWHNVVYGTDTANKANFQVWLHEGDGSISYHYGPAILPKPSIISAYCGAIVFNVDFSGLVDQFNLSGNLSSIQTTYGSTNLSLPRINTPPSDGTIITLRRNTTSVNIIPGNNDVQLYPNPAKGYIMLNTFKQEKVLIYNANGQIVQTVSCTGNEQRVDIRNLTPGIYTLQVGAGNAKNFIVN